MKQPFLLCLLLGLTLQNTPGHAASSTADLHPSSAVLRLTAGELIAEVNSLRSETGLPPFQVNSILMVIAQTHAEYMAGSGVLTHFGADGARPYQRAIAAGYSVAGDLSLGGFFSENIDQGADLSASELAGSWKADPLHLNTMISPDLKDIGVGIAIEDGTTYYVLDAAASTGGPLATPSSALAVSTLDPGTQPRPW